MASPPPDQQPQTSEKNLNLVLMYLYRAQKTTHQLSELIQINGFGDQGKDLINDLLSTFSKVISALDSPTEAGQELELSEVTNGKRKLNHEPYKKTNGRKRVRPALANRTIMSKTIEDGQAWRKYGQKQILNSSNPRSYFRCTHKFDQGCDAQKRVQKSDEDPSIFIITYMGNHTCKNPYSFQLPSSPNNANSCLVSFGSSSTYHFGNKMNQNQDGLTSPWSFQSSKQDGGEETEVLSKSTSEQAGPIRTGLNNEDLLYDQLQDIINLTDLGFDSF